MTTKGTPNSFVYTVSTAPENSEPSASNADEAAAATQSRPIRLKKL